MIPRLAVPFVICPFRLLSELKSSTAESTREKEEAAQSLLAERQELVHHNDDL